MRCTQRRDNSPASVCERGRGVYGSRFAWVLVEVKVYKHMRVCVHEVCLIWADGGHSCEGTVSCALWPVHSCGNNAVRVWSCGCQESGRYTEDMLLVRPFLLGFQALMHHLATASSQCNVVTISMYSLWLKLNSKVPLLVCEDHRHKDKVDS